MNCFTFKKLGRVLLLAAAVAVALSGCGDDNVANGGGSSTATVKIGSFDWMKKNLNVKTEGSWCYDNKDANCNKYGRLYTWEAAKSACESIGMRLPVLSEWSDLVSTAGKNTSERWDDPETGPRLRSKSGWDGDGNGTDAFGFSALPGGYYHPDDGKYLVEGKGGYWWTDTELSSGSVMAKYVWMSSEFGKVSNYNQPKNFRYSVRCIK